jgi:subtilisin family serine protease
MKRLLATAKWTLIAGSVWTASFAQAGKEIEKQIEAVPGEYVVKIRPQVKLLSYSKEQISQTLGAYIKSQIPNQNIVVIKRPVFELQGGVISALKSHPWVEIAEPNFIYHINKLPNDPMMDKLWGMQNLGQLDSSKTAGVAGVDVNAEKAWDLTTGSRDVLVAVIDTGINYNHPDLKDNAWVNEAEANGLAGVDDDKNGVIDDIHGYNAIDDSGDPMDDHGHGSHCSGTIGASGNDGKGIVGVAWNVRIMGAKFLDRNGSGTLEAAIKAIDYATKMGARIMSNSWGGGGRSETLAQAIQRANEANALFIAAAGNESNNNDASPSYPATYDIPNVLAVAAINNRGIIAPFSNFGKKTVHVGAPGVNVFSSTLESKYDSWSGTSMATPHVSGVAALLASYEPTLTNIQMKQRLIATAKPLASLKNRTVSKGMVDAYAALTNTVAPPDPNDPAVWQQMAVSVSSPHPYQSKSNLEYKVEVPGAKEFSLYFAKFETENNYDSVEIYSEDGKLVEKISGMNSDNYSAVIKGSKARIVFKSDDSVNKYGFDITKAGWR